MFFFCIFYPPQFCRRGGEREAESQRMSPLPLSHEHQQAWQLSVTFHDGHDDHDDHDEHDEHNEHDEHDEFSHEHQQASQL